MDTPRRGLLGRLVSLLARRDCTVPHAMSSPGLWALFQISLRGLAPLVAALIYMPRPGAIVLLATTLLLYFVVANDHDGVDGPAPDRESREAREAHNTDASAAASVPTEESAMWQGGSPAPSEALPPAHHHVYGAGSARPREARRRAQAEVIFLALAVALLASLGFRESIYSGRLTNDDGLFWVLALWASIIVVILLLLAPLQLARGLARDLARDHRSPLARAVGGRVVVEVYFAFAVLNALLAALSAAALLSGVPETTAATLAPKGLALLQLAASAAAFAHIRLGRPPRRRDAQAQMQARVGVLRSLGRSLGLAAGLQAATLATALAVAPKLTPSGFWLGVAPPLVYYGAVGVAGMWLGDTARGRRIQARLHETLLRAGAGPHRPGWPRASFKWEALPLSALSGLLVSHGLLFLVVLVPLAGAVHRGSSDGRPWDDSCGLAVGLEVASDILQILLCSLRAVEICARQGSLRRGLRGEIATLGVLLAMRLLEALSLATGGCDSQRLRDGLLGSVVLFFLSLSVLFFRGVSLAGDEDVAGPLWLLLGTSDDYLRSGEAIAAARGTVKNLLGVSMSTAFAIPLLAGGLCLGQGATVASLRRSLGVPKARDSEGDRGADVLLVALILAVVFLSLVVALSMFCRLRRPLYLPLPQRLPLPCARATGVVTALDVLLVAGVLGAFSLAVALFASNFGCDEASGCGRAAGVMLLVAAMAGTVQRFSVAEAQGRLRVETLFQDALVLHSRIDAQQQALLADGGLAEESLEDQLVPGENFTWAELLDARPRPGIDAAAAAQAWALRGELEPADPVLETRAWVRHVDEYGDVTWAPLEDLRSGGAPPEGAGEGDVELGSRTAGADRDPRERLYLRRLKATPDAGVAVGLGAHLGLGTRGGGVRPAGEIEWIDGRRGLPEEDGIALRDDPGAGSASLGRGRPTRPWLRPVSRLGSPQRARDLGSIEDVMDDLEEGGNDLPSSSSSSSSSASSSSSSSSSSSNPSSSSSSASPSPSVPAPNADDAERLPNPPATLGAGTVPEAWSQAWTSLTRTMSRGFNAETDGGRLIVGSPAHGLVSHLFSRVAELPFEGKVTFLRAKAARLRLPWDAGHCDVSVRRAELLRDSVRAFGALDAAQFRQVFRFTFEDDGIAALDAGGVAREWYTLVTAALFDADRGLFSLTPADEISYELRREEDFEAPASEVGDRVPEAPADRGFGWREGFRFAGRFLGKALLDAQVMPDARLCGALCKHLLGRPVGLADLRDVDPAMHRSLTWLLETGGVKAMAIFDEDDAAVTDENKADYVTRTLEARLLHRAEGPLFEMLAGFYEVVPLGLVSVFTPPELARILGGEPKIDLADWKAHTSYSGLASRDARSVLWFWDFVAELGFEQRARLLQFVTGSSRVPVGGFRYLAGADGQRRNFGILGVAVGDQPGESIFPRAHTCFNRIDLPMYKSRDELQKALGTLLEMEVTGFSME